MVPGNRGKTMRSLIIAISLVPTFAFAQAPAQPQQPAPDLLAAEMVLMPRALIPLMEQAILHPHNVDTGDVISLMQQLEACVADNPVNGVVRGNGPDRCPMVTQALAAQAQELADAKKAAAAKPN
jgi:hypothetical protein